MRVAFDEQIFAIQPFGGISRMFAELAGQFIAEPELGVNLLPLNAPIINRYVLDRDDIRKHLAVRDAQHEYYSLSRYFMRLRARKGQDIVHNTFYLPQGLARYPGAKRIVTIHDMIPELLPSTRRRLDFLTVKRHYVSRADHIICVSEATRQDLLSVYPEVSAPVSVIHHGVNPRFSPDAPRLAGLPETYVIFVGNRRQYKDANVLLEAFATVSLDFPKLYLLLVGGGRLEQSEVALIQSLGIHDRVRQVDLRDDEVVSAYAHAELFVFPSRFEGFGIPVLEAMACGVPALLASSTSLPEVGGDAAKYFAAGDSHDLGKMMLQILGDEGLRKSLTEAGLNRASEFTWHKAAIAHGHVYRSVTMH